jgi:hypothetical protein
MLKYTGNLCVQESYIKNISIKIDMSHNNLVKSLAVGYTVRVKFLATDKIV